MDPQNKNIFTNFHVREDTVVLQIILRYHIPEVFVAPTDKHKNHSSYLRNSVTLHPLKSGLFFQTSPELPWHNFPRRGPQRSTTTSTGSKAETHHLLPWERSTLGTSKFGGPANLFIFGGSANWIWGFWATPKRQCQPKIHRNNL